MQSTFAMAAPSTEYIPAEEAISKNMAMQRPKVTTARLPSDASAYKKKIGNVMAVIPKDQKERGKWLKEAEKVGKMWAAMTKLLLDEPCALRLLDEGQVLFLSPHMQMLWEFLAEDMNRATDWKAHHLGAPIGVENEDLPLEAWVKDNDDAGPMPPVIAALHKEDTEDSSVLPGDSQETDQLASNLQKQVILVAKPLISGTLPWGGIPAAVLAPTSAEGGPSTTITKVEEEGAAHAKVAATEVEQEEAKEAAAVEAAVAMDVMEKKEDKPKHPKPRWSFQKTMTVSPPNDSNEVELVNNALPGRTTEQLATFIPASAKARPPCSRGNTMESHMVEVVVPQRVMVKPVSPITMKAGKGTKNKGKAQLGAWNAPEPTN
ncbi:hypothetical protein DACRYDRAFT_109060 [Dacryopinax primogenitus]|uniref:Uncharacterized protein n=1 Tax=Dacryopinax primogenitus (strain DJM 731) TaxID=1858805 RepID=M5G371_DACPD|nr:uncharacterized protein DACRYDRAFT_109060 [Dacryopinax primogenitus]EJU00322.1 hypothetical protein DACRYDRAFT_109060 [Dacryopinax primogenitus]